MSLELSPLTSRIMRKSDPTAAAQGAAGLSHPTPPARVRHHGHQQAGHPDRRHRQEEGHHQLQQGRRPGRLAGRRRQPAVGPRQAQAGEQHHLQRVQGPAGRQGWPERSGGGGLEK